MSTGLRVLLKKGHKLSTCLCLAERRGKNRKVCVLLKNGQNFDRSPCLAERWGEIAGLCSTGLCVLRRNDEKRRRGFDNQSGSCGKMERISTSFGVLMNQKEDDILQERRRIQDLKIKRKLPK